MKSRPAQILMSKSNVKITSYHHQKPESCHLMGDLMILWCIVAVACVSWCNASSWGDEGGAISPIELLSYCSADVAALCLKDNQMPLSDQDIENIVHCLNEFGEHELAPECLNFITTAKSGACNSDANKICTDFETPKEIVECLRRHESQLSTSCYHNLFDDVEEKYEEEMARRELYYNQSTIFITVISSIYLLLPLVISYWAYKNAKAFSHMYLNTVNMEAYTVMRTASDGSSDGGGGSPTVGIDRSATHPCSEISFLGISFWVPKRRQLPLNFLNIGKKSTFGGANLSSVTRSEHQQILHDVSGVFRASQVTAIMGPTGGGKSTLLRLLGGRMNVGTFHGIRSINGSALSPTHYDAFLRKQGFVTQFDTLFQELTVWQTMAYSAMLQMPTHLATLEKMVRAWALVSELGLLEVANSKVGGESNSASGGVERTEGISGGQRRLLSIGLSLLHEPKILLADEPTSGLDSANSLRVIELLHSISRSRHSTVVFSIHQPRPEAFALIDNLILLSSQGQMVYSGVSNQAATFLSQYPGLEPSMLSSISQNPADFIIDVLGLHQSDKEIPSPTPSQKDSLAASLPTTARRGTELASHFRKSKEHYLLHRSVVATLDIPNLKLESCLDSDSSSDNMNDFSMSTSLSSIMSPPSDFIQNILNRTFYERSHRDYSALNVEDVGIAGREDIDIAEDLKLESDTEGLKIKKDEATLRERFVLHVWVLFARRVSILRPNQRDLAGFCAQLVAVAVLLSIAFSYDVETNLEEPYQAIMLIFLLSCYAMMVQYLQIIPEYFVERKIIIMEIANGYVHCIPYILSALLTETPRAVLQTIVLNGIVYILRPLNPAFAQISFSFVCLTVGVSAWQSLLCLCCIISDNINLAYSITFLTLGLGSLFGGLLVKLSNIPVIFRFVYHLSITAVTQRALIVNDLECCYLSVTCTSLLEEMRRRDDICPEDFQGDDKGNLGRWTLKDLEFTDTPILSLLYLFLANILCRSLAVAILYYREKRKYQLKVKVESDGIETRTPANRNSQEASPASKPPLSSSSSHSDVEMTPL